MELRKRSFETLVCCLALLLSPESALKCRQAPAESDVVAQHFRAAQQDMQSGHFGSAIEQFKLVLGLQPDLVEARVNLGLAYNAQGDYSLAVAELSQAATKRPDILPASLFLGLSYLKLGSPEKAIAPLKHTLAIDPSNREARRALASAELAQGHFGKAAAEFERLAASSHDKADGWFTLGQNYLKMSKLLTTELSRRFPDSGWSLRLAGDVLSERRLWNDAASAYRRALAADPTQSGLHGARGEALLAEGKIGQAESEFKAELTHDPTNATALLGLAEAQLQKGSALAALDSVGRIWGFAPDLLVAAEPGFPASEISAESAHHLRNRLRDAAPSPARAFVLAALDRISGDVAQASHELGFLKSAAFSGKRTAPSREACEAHRPRPCVEFMAAQKQLPFADLLRLGQMSLDLNLDDQASRAFATALAQKPDSPEAAYWLDRAYFREADRCFDRLTASYSDSWQTHELQAEAFHLRQSDRDAIREYKAAEALNPDNAEIHGALAETLLAVNRSAEAQTELETALRLDPSAPRSLYLLGRLYVSERQTDKGIPYLEAALHYDPTLVEARPVLGKAYLKAGKPDLAVLQLERSTGIDRYGDLHYLLYQAYRDQGKTALAAQALARSQELRRKSAADDQAKIPAR